MNSNYTIGWYKLAEFVWRKEKEKALAIYRLLSHSLKEKGLAYQLEADILLAFEDPKAANIYAKAANEYVASNKVVEAIAIYDQLNMLDPVNIDYYLNKIDLYLLSNNEKRAKSALKDLVGIAEKNNKRGNLNAVLIERKNINKLMSSF